MDQLWNIAVHPCLLLLLRLTIQCHHEKCLLSILVKSCGPMTVSDSKAYYEQKIFCGIQRLVITEAQNKVQNILLTCNAITLNYLQAAYQFINDQTK